MDSFPLSALKKKACDSMGKGSEHACLVTPPRGCSAHHWVGEELSFLAENSLSCNVFVPCLLPQLLAYSALQKAFGRWRDVAQPLVPI